MNAVVQISEEDPRLLPAIRAIDEARLPAISIPAREIADDAFTYADFGNQAIVQAERANITDAASFGLSGDLMKAINSNLKALEERRKKHTSVIDTLKSYITSLYSPGKDKLERAKGTLQGKLNDWARSEERRLREEAEANRRQMEATALAMAEAQQALGDSAGADQVLEDASRMSQKIADNAKVVGRGAYGSTSSHQKRWVGKVTNPGAFLFWLAQNRPTAILDFVEFKQAGLNKLAKEIGETLEKGRSPAAEIPGMKAEQDVNVRAR